MVYYRFLSHLHNNENKKRFFYKKHLDIILRMQCLENTRCHHNEEHKENADKLDLRKQSSVSYHLGVTDYHIQVCQRIQRIKQGTSLIYSFVIYEINDLRERIDDKYQCRDDKYRHNISILK